MEPISTGVKSCGIYSLPFTRYTVEYNVLGVPVACIGTKLASERDLFGRIYRIGTGSLIVNPLNFRIRLLLIVKILLVTGLRLGLVSRGVSRITWAVIANSVVTKWVEL